MKIFSPLGALRQFDIRAAILTAIILAGHWFRYHTFDLKDCLFAGLVFTAYVVLAAWLAARKTHKL